MPESAIVARWLSRGTLARPVAYDDTGETSWRDAVSRSERIAAELLAGADSLAGERVGLFVSPGVDFLCCFFAVLRAGGVAVVLSPAHPPPETKYLCEDAQVRRVVASPGLAASAAFLAPQRVVQASDDLARSARAISRYAPSDGDPALQLYTSGTTGKPKGALLTHGNLGVQQELLAEAWGLREDDVLLHLLPLNHMHGLCIALLSTVGAGGATRFLRGAPFDAAAAWEAAAKATVLMAVPTIHARLFDTFDASADDTRARWTRIASALRLVTSGSAALPVTLGDRWRALTGAYPLERFGMTEIGVGLSNPLAASDRRPGSVGVPLPSVKVRVVDDGGAPADRGELWIAGPSVFREYHGRPDATREAFEERDGERWFRTGDTVERQPDGYVRILGRTSVDILKSGGYKLSALEIEEALREHPAVGQVAVVGVPDPTWGDRVVACVVPRPGRSHECGESTLRAFLKERLAAYKVPRQVVLLPELPVNALGKVVKPELVKRLATLSS